MFVNKFDFDLQKIAEFFRQFKRKRLFPAQKFTRVALRKPQCLANVLLLDVPL